MIKIRKIAPAVKLQYTADPNFIQIDERDIQYAISARCSIPKTNVNWAFSNRDDRRCSIASVSGDFDIPKTHPERGLMKRTEDGRVGIFVGIDANGHSILCESHTAFYAVCAEFDKQNNDDNIKNNSDVTANAQ